MLKRIKVVALLLTAATMLSITAFANKKVSSVMSKKNLLADTMVSVETSAKGVRIECLWTNKSSKVYAQFTSPKKNTYTKGNCKSNVYNDKTPGKIVFVVSQPKKGGKSTVETWKMRLYSTNKSGTLTWFSGSKAFCKNTEAQFSKIVKKAR